MNLRQLAPAQLSCSKSISVSLERAGLVCYFVLQFVIHALCALELDISDAFTASVINCCIHALAS